MDVDGPMDWFLLILLIGTIAMGSGSAAESAGILFPSTQIEIDDILITIEIQSSGDALWTVEYRSRLDTDDRRDAFETQMQDVNDHPEDFTAELEEQLSETASEAGTATGRPMQIENVSVEAEIRQLPREYGVITYRFTWEGFAATDGDDIRAGPVLSGMFLDEDTRIRIEWPAEYSLEDVRPSPDETRETSVTWMGPSDFGSGEPDVVLSRSTTPLGTYESLPWFVVIGGVVIVVAGGIAYWNHRGRPIPVGRGGQDRQRGDPDGMTGSNLLTNEEQVLELLESSGGRVKQQQVVVELGWSETKTSDVITEMDQDGVIDRFRLGRENIISLPDEECHT